MSNNDKKWASNDKDKLLVENFKKFMKTGDFSPITEAKATQVKDFIKAEYKKYSSVPIGELTSVIIEHLKDLEEMTKEDAIKEIAKQMSLKKIGNLGLQDIMTDSLEVFVKWYLNKREAQDQKLVNFTDDEMSDEELYKDVF